jgi:hypothetical protein
VKPANMRRRHQDIPRAESFWAVGDSRSIKN